MSFQTCKVDFFDYFEISKQVHWLMQCTFYRISFLKSFCIAQWLYFLDNYLHYIDDCITCLFNQMINLLTTNDVQIGQILQAFGSLTEVLEF